MMLAILKFLYSVYFAGIHANFSTDTKEIRHTSVVNHPVYLKFGTENVHSICFQTSREISKI